jgi:drug/metabolite transporter (DMT)-like permease
MSWVFIALLTAWIAASQDAWVKRCFSNFSAYEMLAFPMAYSLPLIGAAWPFIPIPHLDGVFLWSFWVCIPLNAVAMLLHMQAIRISPLSLTLPYLAVTPVFMFFTGYITLGEVPNSAGALGVCVIAAGSYVLNIEAGSDSLLAPIRAFSREKGSLIMVLVAFIYSFTAVVAKKAILHSSVMFFSIAFFTVHNLLILLTLVMIRKVRLVRLAASPGPGLVAGGLWFAHIVCHGWAISMTKAVYMIAIKRISVIFGVLYGGLLFKEKHLLYRSVGTGLMVAGAAVILLKGL